MSDAREPDHTAIVTRAHAEAKRVLSQRHPDEYEDILGIIMRIYGYVRAPQEGRQQRRWIKVAEVDDQPEVGCACD